MAVSVLWVFLRTLTHDVYALVPGDEVRRRMQDSIIEALRTDDWLQVEKIFHTSNAALIIGDASGPRWEASFGVISLDEEYAVASQSKMMTALTIYGLIGASNGTLRLDSLVSDFIEAWPRDNVTLEHLLAQTAGFEMCDDGQGLRQRAG